MSGVPFAESYPDLALEWCESLSGRELGGLLSTSSVQGVWKSPCGHVWNSSINFRARGGTCKVCGGKQVLGGFNDLATTHPELAEQWSPLNSVAASEVMAGDTRLYLWECGIEGHVWKTSPASRVKQRSGCAVCSKHVLMPGVNDLATTDPSIAAWMDDSELEPSQVTSGSPKKVGWTCDKGHHFVRIIHKHVAKKTCPVCQGYVVLSGFNDLATKSPEIAKEWHPTKNAERDPSAEFDASGVSAWWLCQTCGHEWYTTPFERTRNTTGCPRCSGRVVSPGVNDLATRRPDLLAEWDYAKNSVRPCDVSEFSHVGVWWKCTVNPSHVWRTSPSNRATRGCGTCFKSAQSSRSETELYAFVKTAVTGEVRSHASDVISPYEVDVFIPDHNLALEYNGVYWHSEATSTDRLRHKKKLDACISKGVRLIQVWEDDWRSQRDVVESLIRNALGVREGKSVPARRAEVIDISPQTAELVMRENHIQGFKRSTFHRGLLSTDGDVVAVMSVTATAGKKFTLERYATTCRVPGGFSRLLTDLTRIVSAQGGGRIVTFSDNSVFTGDMYAACGFSMTEEIPVDYTYLYKGQRHHKFNFRKKRFRDDPSLKYEDGLTERELSALNGMYRVWDSGKKRWEMDVPCEYMVSAQRTHDATS